MKSKDRTAPESTKTIKSHTKSHQTVRWLGDAWIPDSEMKCGSWWKFSQPNITGGAILKDKWQSNYGLDEISCAEKCLNEA